MAQQIQCPECGLLVWTRQDGRLHSHRKGKVRCLPRDTARIALQEDAQCMQNLARLSRIAAAGAVLHEAEQRLAAVRTAVIDAQQAVADAEDNLLHIIKESRS